MPKKSNITQNKVVDALEVVLNFISPHCKFAKQSSARIYKFYESFFHKYKDIDIVKVLEKSKISLKSQVIDKNTVNQEICFEGIDFVSFCEHHLLKFEGTVSICYIPNNYIIGLDKVSLVVDYFASKLQLQEKLTNEILQAICLAIKPQYIFIKITAKHDCMAIRGQAKKNASIITTQTHGTKNLK